MICSSRWFFFLKQIDRGREPRFLSMKMSDHGTSSRNATMDVLIFVDLSLLGSVKCSKYSDIYVERFIMGSKRSGEEKRGGLKDSIGFADLFFSSNCQYFKWPQSFRNNFKEYFTNLSPFASRRERTCFILTLFSFFPTPSAV